MAGMQGFWSRVGRYDTPPLPGNFTRRPAIDDVLQTASAARLTIVTGGAGAGKTTAVAGWAAGAGTCCWLNVESSDSVAVRLANSILRAIRPVLIGIPDELNVTACAGGARIPVPAIVEALCRLLGERLDGHLHIVLDDLRHLPSGGEAIQLVDGLYRQGPPGLHLVALTRVAPLNWQAREGQESVSRIGPRTLAFTEGDVRAYLAAALGSVDPATVRRVRAATAGLPAAVCLAAELLRIGGVTADRALATPVTASRLVQWARHVLAAQPEAQQSLVHTLGTLGTADARLCRALGHHEARDLLDELNGRGLVHTIDPDRPSYRLTPPLRELLAAEPRGAGRDVRAVHAQAAAYYAEGGEHLPALQHFVAAGDRPAAGRLLVEHGEALLADGAASAVVDAADTLDLPTSDARLSAVLGHARQLHGDWLGALACLRAAAAATRDLTPDLAISLGQLYYLLGQPGVAIEVFQRARIGDPPQPDEAVLLCHAAIWLRAVGADDQARAAAGRAAAAAESCADLSALAHSHRVLALLAAHDGDRPGHDLHHNRAMRLAQRLGDNLLALALHINRASYLAEEGRPAQAIEEADAALRLGWDTGCVSHEPFCRNIRARARARLGQFGQALADLDASERLWRDIGPSFDGAFGLIVRGDIHRRRGEPGQAQAALEEALRSTSDDTQMRPLRVAALAILARTRAADDLGEAHALAQEAVALASGVGRAQALLARGWISLLAGERDQAHADATAARTLAGVRRDQGGLAEALELAVLSAPAPKLVRKRLDEATTLWRQLEDPVGCARAELLAALLSGPAGAHAASLAGAELREHGVRTDSAVADALAVPLTATMPLTVRTLGTFQVLQRGALVPASAWKSKKARDLFKILVIHRGRPVPREQLADMLWPDEPAGPTANRLSVLLSTLRTVLDPGQGGAGPGPIVTDRDTVAVRLDVMDVDLDAFLTTAAAALDAERVGHPDAAGLLAAANAAYTGEFLPDNLYDQWAAAMRDHLRTTHVAVLRALTNHTSDPDQLEDHLLRLLQHDPYDEHTHHHLIDVLHTAGRHGQARLRHQTYLDRMSEIGITPDSPLPDGGEEP